MTKWRVKIALAAILTIFLGLYYFLLELLLLPVNLRIDGNGSWLEDRLVECGSRAIRPTIRTIRDEGIWQRGLCAHFPNVLSRLGTGAHSALLQAIDEEKSPDARANLISCLQRSFADYTREKLWLNSAFKSEESAQADFQLSLEIRRRFRDAPPLFLDGQVNKSFLGWWKATTR